MLDMCQEAVGRKLNKAEISSASTPAPGTSGIPSNDGTGRVKCLLFCSQKIGFYLCAFFVHLLEVVCQSVRMVDEFLINSLLCPMWNSSVLNLEKIENFKLIGLIT